MQFVQYQISKSQDVKLKRVKLQLTKSFIIEEQNMTWLS